MMLSMVFVMITMSSSSIRRIEEVFMEEPDIRNPEQPVTEVADGSIDFNKVGFSYRKGSGKQALTGIDLHIRAGETLGIIGGTGSGKTSLVSPVSYTHLHPSSFPERILVQPSFCSRITPPLPR